MGHRNSRTLAAVAAAQLVAACASTARVEQVGLAGSSFNAGEIGQATLVAREQVTDVVVKVSGVPNTVTRPVHLYAFIHAGSCASLGEQAAYPLTQRVLARQEADGFLTVRSTAPLDWARLDAGAHALVVRSAPADAGQVLFCGNLRAG